MRRQIIVSNKESLSIEDYINFINQCYTAWQLVAVENVDLIIEYQDDFDLPMLLNTQDNWIWGVCDIGQSVDDIAHFAVTELHCKHYIIARIRDGKICNFSIIKGDAYISQSNILFDKVVK